LADAQSAFNTWKSPFAAFRSTFVDQNGYIEGTIWKRKKKNRALRLI